jgi:hypothetical protein
VSIPKMTRENQAAYEKVLAVSKEVSRRRASRGLTSYVIGSFVETWIRLPLHHRWLGTRLAINCAGVGLEQDAKEDIEAKSPLAPFTPLSATTLLFLQFLIILANRTSRTSRKKRLCLALSPSCGDPSFNFVTTLPSPDTPDNLANFLLR